MRSFQALLAAISLLSVTVFHEANNHIQSQEVYTAFQDWKIEHGKEYDMFEEQFRFYNFKATYEFVKNFKSDTQTVGLNLFSDLSQSEFESKYLTQLDLSMKQKNIIELDESAPATIPANLTWVGQSANSPVLNQGQCGSCWSFSAAENLGFVWAQGTNNVNPQFSEQELVDCASAYGNQGCNGGWYFYAWDYTAKYGITTNAAYPYTSGTTEVTGTCPSNIYNTSVYPRTFPNSGVANQADVIANNMTQFNAALNQQVVSVAIQANQRAFQSYTSGVISSGCGTRIDHAVLAVGYTSEYAIIQNSWGPTWGADGYVNLAYNENNNCGACGFLQYPAYAIYSA